MTIQVRAALRLPFTGSGWHRKLAVGGVTTLGVEAAFAALGYLALGDPGLGLAPLAVAVNFPLLGYALEVFRGGLAGDAGKLPEWSDWRVLTFRGLFLALVGLGYSLVPLLMLLAGLNFLVRGGVLLPMAVALIILGLAAALSVFFFMPMGVARYLVEERIEAAFHPVILWGAIARALGEYVATYACAIGAFIVVVLVASVPFAGPLIAPFLAYYFFVVQARLFGHACGRAIIAPPPPPASAPGPAAPSS